MTNSRRCLCLALLPLLALEQCTCPAVLSSPRAAIGLYETHVRRYVDHGLCISFMRFSHDGKWMVCLADYDGEQYIALAGMQTRVLRILNAPGQNAGPPHLAGKPLRIYYYDDRLAALCSVNLEGHHRRIEARRRMVSYDVDRAGRFVAYSESRRSRSWLWCEDLRMHRRTLLRAGEHMGGYLVSIAPLGNLIYFVPTVNGREGPLRVIRRSGTHMRDASKKPALFGPVAATSDGRGVLVLYYGDSQKDEPVYYLRADGSGWRRLSRRKAKDYPGDVDPRTGLAWLSELIRGKVLIVVPSGGLGYEVDPGSYFRVGTVK